MKRPPRGFDPEHRHLDDLKRKSFFVVTASEPELAHSPKLVDEAVAAFRAAAPLSRFIAEALELPF